MSQPSCEMLALRWFASIASQNAPRRLGLRQCANRTRAAHISPSVAETSFLGSNGVCLLEDHLMKLVPIVEIVEVHCVFRGRSVIRDTGCTQDALACFLIVNVTPHCGIMLFNRARIERLRVLLHPGFELGIGRFILLDVILNSLFFEPECGTSHRVKTSADAWVAGCEFALLFK